MIFSVFWLSRDLRREAVHSRFKHLNVISSKVIAELMKTRIEIDNLKGDFIDKSNSKEEIEAFHRQKKAELIELSQLLDVDIIIANSERNVFASTFDSEANIPEFYLNIVKEKIKFDLNKPSSLDMETFIKVPIESPDKKKLGSFFLFPKLNKTDRNFEIFHLYLVISALILGVVIFIITKWLTKPLKEVHLCAEKITKGDYSARIRHKSTDEIGELAAIFNKMIKAVEDNINNSRTTMANISHELRSPLARIRISKEIISDLFLDKICDIKVQNDLRKYFNSIEEEIEDMDSLIDTLLNYFRSETNRNISKSEKINLLKIIRAQNKKIEQTISIGQKDIIFKFTNKLTIPEYEIAGTQELKLAFSNLYNNALKYTSKNGEISITLSSSEKKILFSITNTVSQTDYSLLSQTLKEDQTALFKPFFRGSNAAKKPKGTGLGLSISKNIIENHNGELLVEMKEEDRAIIFKVFI